MSLLDTRAVAALAGLLVVAGALVLDVVLGLVALLGVLAGPPAGSLALALAKTALPYLAVAGVLVAVGAALLVWLVVRLVRNASVDDERLRELATRAERHSEALRRVGLTDRLGPGGRRTN